MWAYAGAIGVTGVALFALGPLWLDSAADPSWARPALVRLSGAAMVAFALVGAGLAHVDVGARRRLLPWFIAAHAAVWLTLQNNVLGASGHAEPIRYATWAMLALVLGLAFVRYPGTLVPKRAPLSLRDTGTGNDAMPAGPYERQIRQAAAQEERNRLARDLHDAVKQQIFAIQASAAAAEARLETDPAGAREAVAQVRQSAREAMREMEALLDQLRAAPLGHTGLVEAIRKQCDALALRTGAQVDLRVGRLPDEESLVPGAHETIYRIVQEALANVGRHARARRVEVSLDDTRNRFEVIVQDDGLGFEEAGEAAPGMGLRNMRARAGEIGGTIDVQSTPGRGTRVILSVPYEAAEVRQYQRRHALLLSALIGVGAVALLIDLIWNGPGFANAYLAVFVLLLARQARTVLRSARRVPSALSGGDS